MTSLEQRENAYEARPDLEATLERVASALSPAGIGRAEVSQMMNQFLAQADAAVHAG